MALLPAAELAGVAPLDLPSPSLSSEPPRATGPMWEGARLAGMLP